MSNTSAEITRWLKAWGRGEDAALDRLTPLVYDELRRRARAYIRHETPGHTLQPTALVTRPSCIWSMPGTSTGTTARISLL